MALHDAFCRSAGKWPERIAVEEPDGTTISYAELDALSDRLRDFLVDLGIGQGDRIGVHLHKSIDSVATLLGILKAGGAYVPVDSTAPAVRNAFIFANCGVKAIIAERDVASALEGELRRIGAAPTILALSDVGGGVALGAALKSELPCTRSASPAGESLAYVLYTSGSTGKPKGVMISHQSATRFVDWCSDVFSPNENDRFSSHAPFHFDLSILDIYTPLRHGARLELISEEIGKDPQRLSSLIASKEISIWYSTPSILSLLIEYGDVDRLRAHPPRIVLFAGEVFPIKRLNDLRRVWPAPRYFNLYGPTETNVCTYYELPAQIEDDRSDPYPIGRLCEHYDGMIVDREGLEVGRGEEGELLIAGDGVMSGYWNLQLQTESAFLESDGKRWYRTGDIVIQREDAMQFVGRRDRMVKKRGYRVELGEIEACLHGHANVLEAAVVAVSDAKNDIAVHAHLSTRDGQKISLIQLKAFCSERIPLYMVPDRIFFHATLPKTSTDKIDYQTLTRHT